MSLPLLNGMKLASLVPASLPWAWDLAPARASHVRKKPGVGREFYGCWRGKGRCSGNAGDVKRSQVSWGAALISFLGSGDGDDSGFFYAGSGTLKNQLEISEGSDCVWFSSESSGVNGAGSAEQPQPWNPPCLESILPLESRNHGLAGLGRGLQGLCNEQGHLQPEQAAQHPIQTRFSS